MSLLALRPQQFGTRMSTTRARLPLGLTPWMPWPPLGLQLFTAHALFAQLLSPPSTCR